SPEQLDGWLHDADGADVLVVGVDDPGAALELASAADAQRPGLPVLLVAGPSPGWHSLAEVEDLGAVLLPLPVTRPSLVAALERLVQTDGPAVAPPAPAPIPPPAPVAAEPEPPAAPPVAAEPPVRTTPSTPPVESDAVRKMVGARSTDA